MSNSEIIAAYFKAIQTGDLAKLGALVAADVIWHQPGDNQFSGTHTGAEAVFAMSGSMMEASAGTFKIDLVKDIMVNGAEVAATIDFSGQRNGTEMALGGVDVFTVKMARLPKSGYTPVIKLQKMPSWVSPKRQAWCRLIQACTALIFWKMALQRFWVKRQNRSSKGFWR